MFEILCSISEIYQKINFRNTIWEDRSVAINRKNVVDYVKLKLLDKAWTCEDNTPQYLSYVWIDSDVLSYKKRKDNDKNYQIIK